MAGRWHEHLRADESSGLRCPLCNTYRQTGAPTAPDRPAHGPGLLVDNPPDEWCCFRAFETHGAAHLEHCEWSPDA